MEKKLFPIVFAILLTGCVSQKAQLLSSDVFYQSPPINTPSGTVPVSGLHSSVSASFSDRHGIATEINGKSRNIQATVGLLLQPSFLEDKSIGPFIGATASGSFAEYFLEPDYYSKQKLDALQIDYGKTFENYEACGKITPGISFKSNDSLFSVFAEGIVTYENGEYYDFRKETDGKGNIYNLACFADSFGYGGGLDFQRKIGETSALGLAVEAYSLYNKSQSFTDESAVINGWSNIMFHSVKANIDENTKMTNYVNYQLEPYFDYGHIRFSLSFFQFGSLKINIGYRW